MKSFHEFIDIAKAVGAMSKNPKRKIGAVILSPDMVIVSTGYNDPPRGVYDLPERYGEPLKQFYMSHAEENAVAQAARVGHATQGCYMLVTESMPCARCSRLIVQAGIAQVYYPQVFPVSEKWRLDFECSKSILNEAGVYVETYI